MAVPDMLQLKDHTLLAFYNPCPFQKDTIRRFAIRVKQSTNTEVWMIIGKLKYK
jgi:hypothetical protein